MMQAETSRPVKYTFPIQEEFDRSTAKRSRGTNQYFFAPAAYFSDGHV